MNLRHGGQLNLVAETLGLDLNGWLDLSTGISPFSYPVPNIPEWVWRNLPQLSQHFLEVANAYYGVNELLVTNGSQSIIQVLPRLYLKEKSLKTGREISVFVPAIGYKEHEKAWCEAGFQVNRYAQLPSLNDLHENSILVVINPNNPTGELLKKEKMNEVYQHLKKQSGWLIVDEAFMDIEDKNNWLTDYAENGHCLVLRSIGKFFGLAGIRVGFAMASPKILTALTGLLGAWQVNGAALYIAEKALADVVWQQQQKKVLKLHAHQLKSLLNTYFSSGKISGTDLFVTLKIKNAQAYYQALCQKKVYVRLCDENNALRFGIPNEAGLKRLKMVFHTLSLNV